MVKSSSLMEIVVSSHARRRWFTQAVVGASLTCVLAAVGVADDRFYVMPDGKKVRVTKSADEYGVMLRSTSEADACAKRLWAAGHGTLQSFKWAPHARVKLLRVPEASASRRSMIRQDPAVQEVRPIYYFEGFDAPAVSTGTIVAKLRPTVSDADRDQVWKDHGIAKAEPVIGQPRVYRLTPADDDEVQAAEVLAADARLLWAQPNFRHAVDLRQVAPSDPLYRLQWHLNNTGQTNGTPGADIDAPEAWAVTSGEGILVGMFDDSCDVDHEDLRDNYSGVGQDASLDFNAEGADDPRPKVPPDRPFFEGDAHGTMVMGTAVARANNLGVRGVAPMARFTVSRGLSDLVSDVEVARAFTFALQQKVDVHINSWGLPGSPDPAVIVDAIDLAFKEGRNKGDLDGDGKDDPLGMVIVFASGNQGSRLTPGFELSMLSQVIGVGASNDGDIRTRYSSYGTGIDVLAPSGDDFRGGIATTDNTDYQDAINRGVNVGGFNADSGLQEADAAGKYTQFFAGTSASCPIVAGVAALVLSVNPMLTATDVRIILEHTADRISPEDAQYNTITNRSLKYGYGRVNAGGAGDNKTGAVEAAQQTLTNGGKTWPDRPGEVLIEGPAIHWTQNTGTDEYLVVDSESAFDFIPQDGECYDVGQTGCGAATLRSLPAGVRVLATGCNLTCSDTDVPGCQAGAAQCVSFTPAAGGKLYFGIYARSSIGRYSFGVAADSDGNVTDSGDVVGGGGSGGTGPPPAGPAVTISVSPLEGMSPLTVHFNGNAVSDVPIDEARTTWDFDVDDNITAPDATSRSATHTYVVEAGSTRTFVARLTMYDTDGRSGLNEVAIRVQGPPLDNPNNNVGAGEVKIIIGVPGTPGSDVAEGTSPFTAALSIDAAGITGILQSVVWDLGDGTRATSLQVTHLYENSSTVAIRIPITATVTTVTSGAITVSTTATRILTIHPGVPVVDPGNPHIPGTGTHGAGGSATPCGGVGMIPMVLALTSLLWMRRRS